jgi:hypothetical protein
MYIGIKAVKPVENYHLLISFDNGEEKIFDMNEYLDKGIFAELKDENLFRTVHINFDTIEWENGADLDPELIYKESKKTADAII